MKNSIKQLVLITSLCLAPSLVLGVKSAQWSTIQKKLSTNPRKLFSITIPKSGTHLLTKCIQLMHAKDPARFKDHKPHPGPEHQSRKCVKIPPTMLPSMQEGRFKRRVAQRTHRRETSFHLAHTPAREQFVKQSYKAAILMIRDPRDQLVSFTKWACTKSRLGTEYFNKMLLSFIDGTRHNDIYVIRMTTPSKFLWSYGIAEYYKLYLPWMAADNVYTVRFEDLVGQEGGGSRQAQVQEIYNIARHLKLELSPEKINAVADNLFGGTNTFNKGQIGSWKEYFTKEHKQAFKKVAGQLLIDLGYEKDMNW